MMHICVFTRVVNQKNQNQKGTICHIWAHVLEVTSKIITNSQIHQTDCVEMTDASMKTIAQRFIS